MQESETQRIIYKIEAETSKEFLKINPQQVEFAFLERLVSDYVSVKLIDSSTKISDKEFIDRSIFLANAIKVEANKRRLNNKISIKIYE